MEVYLLRVTLPDDPAKVRHHERQRPRLRGPEPTSMASSTPAMSRSAGNGSAESTSPIGQGVVSVGGRLLGTSGGREVDRILSDRERDAALASILLSCPGHSIRKPEAHQLPLEVDDRVDHVVSLVEGSREPTHICGRIDRIQAREKDRRT